MALDFTSRILAREAEDIGEIVSLAEDVNVPAGSWSNCLKTRGRSVVDPEADEYGYYCAGVGSVLDEEDDTRVELIEYARL